MDDIVETGGAKIGMARATWPFAKLTVNKNVLQLNASVIGNLYFRPSDIISIEPSSFLSSNGIKINHRVEKYSANVIFLTSGGSELINRIEAIGFLHNTDPLPWDVEAEITKYQSGGRFPFKWPAAIAFVVIWNILFLGDEFGYFKSNPNGIPIGMGGKLALAFAFLSALAITVSEPIRKAVLKEGRTINDVKRFLLFLMFITGIMFVALCSFPN